MQVSRGSRCQRAGVPSAEEGPLAGALKSECMGRGRGWTGTPGRRACAQQRGAGKATPGGSAHGAGERSAESFEEQALSTQEKTAGRVPPGKHTLPTNRRVQPFPEDPGEDWPETAPWNPPSMGTSPECRPHCPSLAPEHRDAHHPAWAGAHGMSCCRFCKRLALTPRRVESRCEGKAGGQGEGSGLRPWLLSP